MLAFWGLEGLAKRGGLARETPSHARVSDPFASPFFLSLSLKKRNTILKGCFWCTSFALSVANPLPLTLPKPLIHTPLRENNGAIS